VKITLILSLNAPLLALYAASAQGNFGNLNFEQANLSAIPPSTLVFVSISDGLPNWTGYIGANQATQILHNGLTLGAPSISILGPDYFANQIIAGKYTAVLQSGEIGASLIDTSIGQTGLVPADARFLQFKSWGSSQPVLSFAGNNIPFSAIGSAPITRSTRPTSRPLPAKLAN
jgi:hypothetical protein